MNKFLQFVVTELKEALPPTIFFAVRFRVIVLTQRLILSEYMLHFAGYMVATTMAL
jgi:hypothetical protein